MHGSIEVAVFDAYGTLFDVHAATRALASELGDRMEPLSRLWRQKQLEYTWLRSLMRAHADFWQVTEDALDYALAATGGPDDPLRQRLLDLYLTLDAYPEVKDVLTKLRAGGLKTAILSNGSPKMLQAAVDHAGLDELLDDILSVEPMQTFKPTPVVYRLPSVRFGVLDRHVAFMTANAWDAAGASEAGLRVVWVNRFAQPPERLPTQPEAEISDLGQLPDVLIGADRDI